MILFDYVFQDFILFTGLGLMGIGYFLKDQRKHDMRSIGFVLFSLYWALQAPHFFFDYADPVNALFCAAGLPFFGYLAYQEQLSKKFDVDHNGLKFIAGAAFLAGSVYFMTIRFTFLTANLIELVADQTVAILNILGYDFTAGSIDYAGYDQFYTPYIDPNRHISSAIINSDGDVVARVALACTALQSMLIFAGAIFATSADRIRKIKAAAVIIGILHIFNLTRNVSIVYLVHVHNISLEVAHNYVGKFGSLIGLIVLAYVLFHMLPEVLDNISSLFDIPKRKEILEGLHKEDGTPPL